MIDQLIDPCRYLAPDKIELNDERFCSNSKKSIGTQISESKDSDLEIERSLICGVNFGRGQIT